MKKLIILLFVIAGCSNPVSTLLDKDIAGICLTFDDNYVASWYNFSDSLMAYNIKATFFITRPFEISPENISLLQKLEAKGFEIGAHGFNHLNSIKYLEKHSIDEYYNAEIKPLLKFFNDNNLIVNSFSYPYGLNNNSTDSLLSNYFGLLRDVTDEQRKPLTKSILKIDEVFTKLNSDIIRTGLGIDSNFKITLNSLDSALVKCKNNNKILLLYCHNPVLKEPKDYQISYNYLTSIFKMVQKYKLKTYKFSVLKIPL